MNSGSNYKCNNCTKGERPVLLQTPISPSKNQQLQHKSSPNSQHKSEQKRPNHNLNVCNSQCSAQCGNNTLSVNRSNSRHKLRHQNSSSQSGSYESTSPCLSRGMQAHFYKSHFRRWEIFFISFILGNIFILNTSPFHAKIELLFTLTSLTDEHNLT